MLLAPLFITQSVIIAMDLGTLCDAVEKRDLTRVNMLIERGANVNQRCPGFGNETPLMKAIDKRNYAIVEALLKAHADTSLENEEGSFALSIAADNSDCQMINLLIAYHANINQVSSVGVTVLKVLAMNASEDIPEDTPAQLAKMAKDRLERVLAATKEVLSAHPDNRLIEAALDYKLLDTRPRFVSLLLDYQKNVLGISPRVTLRPAPAPSTSSTMPTHRPIHMPFPVVAPRPVPAPSTTTAPMAYDLRAQQLERRIHDIELELNDALQHHNLSKVQTIHHIFVERILEREVNQLPDTLKVPLLNRLADLKAKAEAAYL